MKLIPHLKWMFFSFTSFYFSFEGNAQNISYQNNQIKEIKQWMLTLEKKEGVFYEQSLRGHLLIVGYTDKRAKNDKYNREKGIRRLQKEYKNGNITKENINKRGYNKFLEISDNVQVKINQDKIKEDEKWDGLKGYITNTTLQASEVCAQYNGLGVIERAYRITKGTIETPAKLTH
jgi:hypothetical protein